MGMMKVFVLVSVAALTAAFAGAMTLDEVGGTILGDPRVQIDLGITKAQYGKASSRRMKNTYRLMLLMLLTAKEAVASDGKPRIGTDKDAKISWDASDDDLKPDDLTRTQRARLRELALQLTPSFALSTAEAQRALGITGEQADRLEAIFPPHDTHNAPGPAMNAMIEFQKEFERALASVEAPDFTVENTLRTFDQAMEKNYAKLAKESERVNSLWEGKELKDKVLAILTADQRRRLTELQGKRLR